MYPETVQLSERKTLDEELIPAAISPKIVNVSLLICSCVTKHENAAGRPVM
jgi:hypothetical protein